MSDRGALAGRRRPGRRPAVVTALACAVLALLAAGCQTVAAAAASTGGTGSGGCQAVDGFQVCDPVYDRYTQLGGPTGPLGRPLLDPRPAVGADSVSYFQGGAVFATGARTDVHQVPGGEVPAVDVPSVYSLPLADFVVVRDARAAGPPGVLVWTTDGCSGPTPPEVDALFADPCLRHDFGYRNFLNGPAVDPTGQRRLAIDNQFLVDLRATCGTAGQPQVNWFGVMMPCERAALLMYNAVRAFG
ncbi:phospholipase [Parafrankia discariae]|uniref:phospholipase n=1 Tax=Parafrankia discariae TaxID=365528 RepID=UPI00037FE458|nr:phospholipase [Parafrankia discariae]